MRSIKSESSKETRSNGNNSIRNDDDPREYGELSSAAKRRTAAIYLTLMLAIAMNVVAIGLSGSAFVRDNNTKDVIGGSRGNAFSDDCWSCEKSQANSTTYEVMINARMESKVKSGDGIKKLFQANGFRIGEQFEQLIDGATGNLFDPEWFGDSIVQSGVQWESEPGKQGVVYSKGRDTFEPVPANDTYHSQFNPGRKYCDSMGDNISGQSDVVYMFLDFKRSYESQQAGASLGYWPEQSLNGTDYPCANYLGAVKMFFCASEENAAYMGCTTTNIDNTCDRSFETTWIGLNAPAGNYA